MKFTILSVQFSSIEYTSQCCTAITTIYSHNSFLLVKLKLCAYSTTPHSLLPSTPYSSWTLVGGGWAATGHGFHVHQLSLLSGGREPPARESPGVFEESVHSWASRS